jgi:dethiobiotin synthetase
MRKIFVTGIGTDIGKTVVSAILTEAFHADYWKPVQTGSYLSSDSDMVASLVSNEKSKIHPEVYVFQAPMSPHAAAEKEGSSISLSNIILPITDNNIIIEGAGGIMVPLNQNEFVLDMIKKFDAEAVIVIQNYLGSINHSLLTIDVLKQHNINILGLVFNGPMHKMSEDIILQYSGLKCLGRISREPSLNKEVILKYAREFSSI